MIVMGVVVGFEAVLIVGISIYFGTKVTNLKWELEMEERKCKRLEIIHPAGNGNKKILEEIKNG